MNEKGDFQQWDSEQEQRWGQNHKSESFQSPLQFINVTADFIKRLYIRSGNKGSLGNDLAKTSQKTKSDFVQTKATTTDQLEEDISDLELNVSLPEETVDKILECLEYFLTNHQMNRFVSFYTFMKQYSVLVMTNPTTETYLEVIFALFSRGKPYISSGVFQEQILKTLNISTKQLQQERDSNDDKNQHLGLKQQKQSSKLKPPTENNQQNQPPFILLTQIDLIKFKQLFKGAQKKFPNHFIRFQHRFNLVNQMKINKKYKKIEQLILENQMQDPKPGETVYLVSAKWYERFTVFFQKLLAYRSQIQQLRAPQYSKNLNRDSPKKFSHHKVKNKSPAHHHLSEKQTPINPMYSKDRIISIDYADIESLQYENELRKGIKPYKDIKVISKPLYRGLFRLFEGQCLQGSQIHNSISLSVAHSIGGKEHSSSLFNKKGKFQRYIQNSDTRFDQNNDFFYPKCIHLYRTFTKTGKIDYQSQQVLHLSEKLSLSQLRAAINNNNTHQKNEHSNLDQKLSAQSQQSSSFFTKLFEQKNFRQETNHNTTIRQLLNNQQQKYPLIIVITSKTNRLKFLSLYTRKQITEQNLNIGDKVQGYNEFSKTYLPCYITNISIPEANTKMIKIHYIGKSYREDTEVNEKLVSLSFPQTNGSIVNLSGNTLTKPSSVVGLYNVGNTCYINSSIQCLYTTNLLRDYLIRQSQGQRQSSKNNPLSGLLMRYFEGIQLREKLSTVPTLMRDSNKKPMTEGQFKKQLTSSTDLKLFQQFRGVLQHDVQQFIHAILDQLSQEYQQLMEGLFEIQIESQLKCALCEEKKYKHEKLSMLSLSIPETEWIFIEIVFVPIYRSSIQKIVIKVSRNAKLKDLMSKFEERTGVQSENVVFVETDQNGAIKKFRRDVNSTHLQQKTLSDIGFIVDMQLNAYELIKASMIEKIHRKGLQMKEKKHFYDFYIREQKIWTLSYIKDLHLQSDPIKVEYMNEQKNIGIVKIPEGQWNTQKQHLINKMGSRCTELQYRRIYLRKQETIDHEQSREKKSSSVFVSKMQEFGLEFLIGLPLWCSYNDAIQLIEHQLKNITTSQHSYSAQIDKDYVIRFVGYQKGVSSGKCIFCEQQIDKLSSSKVIKRCCKVLQADRPINWILNENKKFTSKNFVIFVDWISLKKYNGVFGTSLQMDRECQLSAVEKQNQKTSLHQCFAMLNAEEHVGIKCQNKKCPSISRHTEQQNHRSISSSQTRGHRNHHNGMLLKQSISSTPPILILQLKQFRYLQGLSTLVKLNINLDFEEIQQINIKRYLSENVPTVGESNSSVQNHFHNNSTDFEYELYALISHTGSGDSGHYTCLTKRFIERLNREVWVFFDDEMVQVILEGNEEEGDQMDHYFGNGEKDYVHKGKSNNLSYGSVGRKKGQKYNTAMLKKMQPYIENAYMLFYRKKYLTHSMKLKLGLI